ncbi:winged helix-turn-helix transcriptional regulator [Glutamicibacter ardleyensis]|uniref:winged helix-turn-helix transcriptional regulator n=1 Tax=Glutamicibacter TaxID=1742989 RepID=UPI001868771D|nr:winged helix-turn-helix transcriptional regulator [Glutamicibacter arilaitensis]
MTQVYARIPRNGKTARELAEKVGMSSRTAQRWTSEPREVYLQRAAQRHERIKELREAGLSMRAISKEVGIAVSAVHYALQKDQAA